jgi:hypothetical protein
MWDEVMWTGLVWLGWRTIVYSVLKLRVHKMLGNYGLS